MPLSTIILGALTLSLVLAGSNAKVFEATSKCSVTASGSTEEQLGRQRAKAVQEASAYVCTEEGQASPDIDVPAIAKATATAFAKAFTSVFVECSLQGKGSVEAGGYAAAYASGKAWLKAYAEAWADAEVCDSCLTEVHSVVEVTERVFLDAMSELEEEVELFESDEHDGDSGLLTAGDVDEHIVTATADAIAAAIAVAGEDALNSGCFAATGAVASTEENFAACGAIGVSFSENKVKNAVAEAVAEASNLLCDDDGLTEDDAYDVAEDVAKATAKAVAIATSGCIVEGTAKKACATSETNIDTVAIATAEAFADGWAEANDCNCDVNGNAAVIALGGILVEASASAYSTVCPTEFGRTHTFEDYDLDFEIMSDTDRAKALATAILDLVPNEDGSCSINIDVEASVCECVEKPKRGRAVCKERGSPDVFTCCQENHVCESRQGGKKGVCKRADKVAAHKRLPITCLLR